MMKKSLVIALAAGTLLLAGCLDESQSNSRTEGTAQQESVMQSAISAVPTYKPENFLTREAVRKWMERMDTPNKTFYVYILADNGNVIGYYVAQTRPINECTLMTPPDREKWKRTSNGLAASVTAAPSLDGVYGRGGCETYFFFDAETDAFIDLKGLDFLTADQPLSIEAEPITVQMK